MKNQYFANGLTIINKKAIVLFLSAFCSFSFLHATSYKDIGNNIWKEFRMQFSTPFRTIACHEMNDGRRIYIISEPPNNVSINDFEKIFDGYVHYIWTNTTKIGYDGMMRDVVVYTDGIPEFCHRQIVFDLNQLLYGTTYKASYITLPYKGQPKSCFYNMDINLTVNDKTLYDWTLGEKQKFKNVLTGSTITPYDLFKYKQYGVYSSMVNNIVVWCIPYKGDISEEGHLFHIFQIESDLLLGAIFSNNVVIIIGRKRLCDIITIPPLREDEALMLAAANETVKQSLNMATPVYCKINGSYDWCPAWVSENIEHSEYAYLLTLTDLYLKFWLPLNHNNHNDYDIVGYSNCKPTVQFKHRLFNKIPIQYIWNTDNYTKNSLYNHLGQEYIVIHFNNVGCLNFNLFNYMADTALNHMQNLACEFMIKQNNVDVFRVAQYTMLYELFRLFDITANRYPSRTGTSRRTLPYFHSAQIILTRIKDLSDAEILSISKEIYRKEIEPHLSDFTREEQVEFVRDIGTVAKMRKKWEDALYTIAHEKANTLNISYEHFIETKEYKLLSQKAKSEIDNRSLYFFSTYENEIENFYCMEVFVNPIKKSRDRLCSLSSAEFNNLCYYCASPNTYNNHDSEQLEKLCHSVECLHVLSCYSRYFDLDINKMFNDYVKHYENSGTFWFKAPSVVAIDNNRNHINITKGFRDGSMLCIGGHSIVATIKDQPQSHSSQGKEILTLTGNPVGDAYYYGQKAVNAVSRDDMYRYHRKSVEALSEEITPNKRLGQYSSLSSKIERALITSAISNDKHTDKQEIINDYKEVIDIAQSELSNNNDLAPEKKESYRFVISEVLKVTESITEQEEDDEELKRLREHLKRLELTIVELKKNQGGGK